jgi:glutamate-1-semialdehyde 2,1-aminomutase
MDYVSPTGPVYQAGTLSGNPLAMRAGYAILSKIADEKDRIYRELEDYAEALQKGTEHNLDALGLDYTTHQVGAMGSLFFTGEQVVDQDTAKTSDTDRYAAYFHAMLEAGIYLPPSQFEAMFFGTCHNDWELDETLKTQRRALERVHS